MFSHERFRELSALAVIGHLSREEERELEDHLRECASCRDVRGEYARVVRQLMAHAEGMALSDSDPLSHSLNAKRRDRLFARLRDAGVNLSVEAEMATPELAESPSDPRRPALHAGIDRFIQVIGHSMAPLSAAALVLIAISAVWISGIKGEATRANAAESRWLEVSAQNESFREELARFREQVAKQTIQLEGSQKVIAAMRKSQAKFRETNGANNALIAHLHAENARLARQREDDLIMKQVVDAHLAEVTHELADRKATLERVSQLLTVTPDVLKLMGAQRLHIVDVHDFDESGQSVKSFGRIFYAENQAFVFYAFDLPDIGLNPATTTFHAWGQRNAEPNSPRKLGTFELDRERHRWVLQVKDPALLAGMDYVFVTAGPRSEIDEPRGRRLLHAYIGGQPNHP